MLVVIVLIVYVNSWGNPFILDDVTHIESPTDLDQWQNWTEVFTSPFFEFKEAGLAQYYRPLVKLTYKIERILFGINPFGYHLVNTAFHCLNTLLLYLICRLLIGRAGPAFAAALIFGIHPLQTEEVTYISGLGGLGGVTGILASLYFFLRFMKNGRIIWYLASLCFFLIGLFYKEIAFILPVMLVWLFITGSPPRNRTGNRWTTDLLYIIPYILCLGGYLYLRAFILVKTDFPAGMDEGAWIRFLTFGKGLWIYLGLSLFPIHLHFYRSLALLSHCWHPLSLIGLCCCAVFLLRTVLRGARISPLVSVGFGWFMIALLPFSGIVPILLETEYLYWAEHFMYLPLAGLGMVLAGLFSGWLSAVWNRQLPRIIAGACSILLVLSLGLLTIRQNGFWSDELIFFERMADYEPDLFRTTGLLGVAYLKGGRPEDALRADINARKLLLSHSGAASEEEMGLMDQYMLKVLVGRMTRSYLMLRQYDSALEMAREFQVLDPESCEGKYLLGRAFAGNGNNEEALPFLLAAYSQRPDNFEITRSLIFCYQNLGEFERSQQIWSEASGRIPEFRKAKEILKKRDK